MSGGEDLVGALNTIAKTVSTGPNIIGSQINYGKISEIGPKTVEDKKPVYGAHVAMNTYDKATGLAHSYSLAAKLRADETKPGSKQNYMFIKSLQRPAFGADNLDPSKKFRGPGAYELHHMTISNDPSHAGYRSFFQSNLPRVPQSKIDCPNDSLGNSNPNHWAPACYSVWSKQPRFENVTDAVEDSNEDEDADSTFDPASAFLQRKRAERSRKKLIALKKKQAKAARAGGSDCAVEYYELETSVGRKGPDKYVPIGGRAPSAYSQPPYLSPARDLNNRHNSDLSAGGGKTGGPSRLFQPTYRLDRYNNLLFVRGVPGGAARSELLDLSGAEMRTCAEIPEVATMCYMAEKHAIARTEERRYRRNQARAREAKKEVEKEKAKAQGSGGGKAGGMDKNDGNNLVKELKMRQARKEQATADKAARDKQYSKRITFALKRTVGILKLNERQRQAEEEAERQRLAAEEMEAEKRQSGGRSRSGQNGWDSKISTDNNSNSGNSSSRKLAAQQQLRKAQSAKTPPRSGLMKKRPKAGRGRMAAADTVNAMPGSSSTTALENFGGVRSGFRFRASGVQYDVPRMIGALKLSNNYLPSLNGLGPQLRTLGLDFDHIQWLDLSFNQIATLTATDVCDIVEVEEDDSSVSGKKKSTSAGTGSIHASGSDKGSGSAATARKCAILYFPNLRLLNLTGNQIASMKGLKGLSGLQALRTLSLSGNPICSQLTGYRNHIICVMPQLSKLDASPVTKKEKHDAIVWRRVTNKGKKPK